MLWIPADRLLAVLDTVDSRELSETVRKLMGDLRSGRQEFVSLDRVDRILTRLDLNQVWHLPENQGGLADIYEDGAQYGEPRQIVVSRLPRPHMRKYATEEDRREARLATYRRYQERKKQRLEKAA